MTGNSSGPGEAVTRRRKRRQLAYFGVAVALGAVLGGVMAANKQGNSSVFSADFADLRLDPGFALALAAAWVLAMLALPLWGFTKIDEHARYQNLVGFTGGCLAVLAGYPVWAMLYAGGFAPYPHAFGIFAIGFLGMAASFAFAKLRDR